jgi:hypothetical protein
MLISPLIRTFLPYTDGDTILAGAFNTPVAVVTPFKLIVEVVAPPPIVVVDAMALEPIVVTPPVPVASAVVPVVLNDALTFCVAVNVCTAFKIASVPDAPGTVIFDVVPVVTPDALNVTFLVGSARFVMVKAVSATEIDVPVIVPPVIATEPGVYAPVAAHTGAEPVDCNT